MCSSYLCVEPCWIVGAGVVLAVDLSLESIWVPNDIQQDWCDLLSRQSLLKPPA